MFGLGLMRVKWSCINSFILTEMFIHGDIYVIMQNVEIVCDCNVEIH